MNEIDIFKRNIIFEMPKRIDASISWVEHIPFAFLLIDILRPKIFVELGVHTGNSFFAFCQAVKSLGINTKCYGVDWWKGDQHAGFYGKDVYQEVLKYQKSNYKEFSKLLTLNFDDALKEFGNKEIDLLHIDGYHTYEAVSHDFNSWLPKMSERGVIVLHDTQVRENNFGVWKLWKKIARDYPSFEFSHGYGLGIVGVGKNLDDVFLKFINKLKNDDYYQNLFFRLGDSILKNFEVQQKEKEMLKYINSTSWKITKPLRKIKSLLMRDR